MVLEQRDVRMLRTRSFSVRDHRVAGGVGGVDDAALAVAAFARQVEAQFGGLVPRERHALLDQPFDRLAPVLDDEARGRLVAQAGAGDQGVVDVLVDAVARIEHGGDAALRPVAGAVADGALGDDGDAPRLRQVQGDGQAGQAAADDCYVEFHAAASPSICLVCRLRPPDGSKP